MRLGTFLTVWAAAFTLVAACVWITHVRLDVHAVLIGTSQTDRALPDTDAEIARLIGGPYTKHPHRGIKRHEIIRELRLAEHAEARIAFVEISHFIYRPDWTDAPSNWFREGWWPLRNLGHFALADTRVIGFEFLSQLGINRWSPSHHLDLPNRVSDDAIGRMFPVHPGPAREYLDLVAAINRLQAKGTDVILLMTPFSELAYRHAGDGVHDKIIALAADLQTRTGAALFAPTSPWVDTLYTDAFHLNRAGRQSFRDRFVAWLKTRKADNRDG